MFTRLVIVPVMLLAAGAALGALAQERVKPPGTEDFNALHGSLKRAFEAGHFGKAYETSKKLTAICSERRSVTIRAALPEAPGDYALQPPPKNSRQMALMDAVATGAGNIIETTYQGPEGQVKTTVTTDSPFIKMFSTMVGNESTLQENQELIKYGKYMAVLERHGQRRMLRLVMDGTMVQTVFPDVDDDFIFGMWNQAAVDKLAAALSR